MRLRLAVLLSTLAAIAGPLGAQELPKPVLDKVKASTVFVVTSKGTGTAFVFARSGTSAHLLTCDHVVSGETKVKVVFNSGQKDEAVLEAEVSGNDPQSDLASLRVKNAVASAQPLDVVEADEPSHRVADDVDLGDARLGDDRLDLARDQPGGVADIAQVDGAEPEAHDDVAALGQVPLEQVQRAARGQVAVDQQHGRTGRRAIARGVHVGGGVAAVAPVAAQELPQVDRGVAGVDDIVGQLPRQGPRPQPQVGQQPHRL